MNNENFKEPDESEYNEFDYEEEEYEIPEDILPSWVTSDKTNIAKLPIFGGDYVLGIINGYPPKGSTNFYIEIRPSGNPKTHPDIDLADLIPIISTTQILNICVAYLTDHSIYDMLKVNPVLSLDTTTGEYFLAIFAEAISEVPQIFKKYCKDGKFEHFQGKFSPAAIVSSELSGNYIVQTRTMRHFYEPLIVHTIQIGKSSRDPSFSFNDEEHDSSLGFIYGRLVKEFIQDDICEFYNLHTKPDVLEKLVEFESSLHVYFDFICQDNMMYLTMYVSPAYLVHEDYVFGFNYLEDGKIGVTNVALLQLTDSKTKTPMTINTGVQKTLIRFLNQNCSCSYAAQTVVISCDKFYPYHDRALMYAVYTVTRNVYHTGYFPKFPENYKELIFIAIEEPTIFFENQTAPIIYWVPKTPQSNINIQMISYKEILQETQLNIFGFINIPMNMLETLDGTSILKFLQRMYNEGIMKEAFKGISECFLPDGTPILEKFFINTVHADGEFFRYMLLKPLPEGGKSDEVASTALATQDPESKKEDTGYRSLLHMLLRRDR